LGAVDIRRNGGYTERLRRADADWVCDYEITDRKDLVKGRVVIENRPMGDAVGAINKVLRHWVRVGW
jgi:hypothetical protein